VGFDPFGPGIDGISCRREGRSIGLRAPEILPIGPPGASQFHSVAPGFRFPAIFSSGFSQFPVSERFGASGAEFRAVYALDVVVAGAWGGIGSHYVLTYSIMAAPRPAVKPARVRRTDPGIPNRPTDHTESGRRITVCGSRLH
jgi:hypothetical protein